MANLDAVKEAAQALVEMISEADARDMVGKRKPVEPMPPEPIGEEEDMEAALAEGGLEEPPPEEDPADEMTPEKRRKMLGF